MAKRRVDGLSARMFHREGKSTQNRPICLRCGASTDACYRRKRTLSKAGKAQYSFESVPVYRLCPECGPLMESDTMTFTDLIKLFTNAKKKRAIVNKEVRWRVEGGIEKSIDVEAT